MQVGFPAVVWMAPFQTHFSNFSECGLFQFRTAVHWYGYENTVVYFNLCSTYFAGTLKIVYARLNPIDGCSVYSTEKCPEKRHGNAFCKGLPTLKRPTSAICSVWTRPMHDLSTGHLNQKVGHGEVWCECKFPTL